MAKKQRRRKRKKEKGKEKTDKAEEKLKISKPSSKSSRLGNNTWFLPALRWLPFGPEGLAVTDLPKAGWRAAAYGWLGKPRASDVLNVLVWTRSLLHDWDKNRDWPETPGVLMVMRAMLLFAVPYPSLRFVSFSPRCSQPCRPLQTADGHRLSGGRRVGPQLIAFQRW